jgi:hypothetical protein
MSRTSLLLRLVIVKKIIKRTLGILGVLVLIPVLRFAVLFATREPPDGPRVPAGPGIVGIEAGGAYAWIVRTPHGAVLIDAGLDASGAAILGELAAEHVAPRDVLAVLRAFTAGSRWSSTAPRSRPWRCRGIRRAAWRTCTPGPSSPATR